MISIAISIKIAISMTISIANSALYEVEEVKSKI
jgi:hypothetical protein